MKQIKKNCRRSTMVETLLCIMLLGLLLIPFLQLFMWCMQFLYAEYSAFTAARSLSLGYSYGVVNNHARVAAIGMSGRELSRRSPSGSSVQSKERIAESYMRHGDGSGVNFEYWHPRSAQEPFIEIWKYPSGERAAAAVRLVNAPLLVPALSWIIPGGVEPASSVTLYNHAGNFLDSE